MLWNVEFNIGKSNLRACPAPALGAPHTWISSTFYCWFYPSQPLQQVFYFAFNFRQLHREPDLGRRDGNETGLPHVCRSIQIFIRWFDACEVLGSRCREWSNNWPWWELSPPLSLGECLPCGGKLCFTGYGSSGSGPPGYGGKVEIQTQSQLAMEPPHPTCRTANFQSSHEPHGLVSVL